MMRETGSMGILWALFIWVLVLHRVKRPADCRQLLETERGLG
jgi:hypothetical protein